MNIQGLSLCSRFSFPPNSLSLCGPDKQTDLSHYSQSQKTDAGTIEILSQFSTLYPYLSFIAYENNIKDPFDQRVVEAYWIGNQMLHRIPERRLAIHFSDNLKLKQKISYKNMSGLLDKIPMGLIPFHASHVLNVYKRTGHTESLHTIQSMDACIINWGKVISKNKNDLNVQTQALTLQKNHLTMGPKRVRNLMKQGPDDLLFQRVEIGDFVSYHWGYFCSILSQSQVKRLMLYTQKAIDLANTSL